MFLIGTCTLGEATEAVIGADPASEVLAALAPVMDGAVPGLEGRMVADALVGISLMHYRYGRRGRAALLNLLEHPAVGHALQGSLKTARSRRERSSESD